jgi:hypothetical protein
MKKPILMKILFKITLLITALITLQSCEKELDVRLPFEGERLVIYGLISPDSTFHVTVGKTYPPTGKYNTLEDYGVEGAEVTIYENGSLLETLTEDGKGSYRSFAYKPRVGISYIVKVKAIGYPDAESEPELVPTPVRLIGHKFDEEVVSPFNESVPSRKLSVTFEDEGSEVNFYVVQLQGYYDLYRGATTVFDMDRPDGIEDICGFRAAGNRYVLKDACFNGRAYTRNFGIELSGAVQDGGSKDGPNALFDTVTFSLKKVNKSYSDYLYTGYQDDSFLSAFVPISNQYNNIKGGYGIWAAYSEAFLELKP